MAATFLRPAQSSLQAPTSGSASRRVQGGGRLAVAGPLHRQAQEPRAYLFFFNNINSVGGTRSSAKPQSKQIKSCWQK
jgi:hypothetical protein